jgi:dephospho-CoA kinase
MTKIIGITGGIGSGKTTVVKYLIEKGFPVYIADHEAKNITNLPDTLKEIHEVFGKAVFDKDKLNRQKLRELVFENPEKLAQLNAIIHPKVKQHFKNWLAKHKNYPFVIKEVAILFETNGQKDCYKTILVTAKQTTRIKRVMQRDNLTEKVVLKIIKNQMPESKKKNIADFVIFNEDLQKTYKKVDKIIKILQEK